MNLDYDTMRALIEMMYNNNVISTKEKDNMIEDLARRERLEHVRDR